MLAEIFLVRLEALMRQRRTPTPEPGAARDPRFVPFKPERK